MQAGAFAAIFDDKRQVLLCHRRDIDAWNLPGGPGLSDEADEVGYFSVDALPANTARTHVERIRDALVEGPAVLRTETGPSMRDLFGAPTPA